jgi:hypothetical protein
VTDRGGFVSLHFTHNAFETYFEGRREPNRFREGALRLPCPSDTSISFGRPRFCARPIRAVYPHAPNRVNVEHRGTE